MTLREQIGALAEEIEGLDFPWTREVLTARLRALAASPEPERAVTCGGRACEYHGQHIPALHPTAAPSPEPAREPTLGALDTSRVFCVCGCPMSVHMVTGTHRCTNPTCGCQWFTERPTLASEARASVALDRDPQETCEHTVTVLRLGCRETCQACGAENTGGEWRVPGRAGKGER